MTVSAIATRPPFPVALIAARSRGLLIAIVVFAILFAILNIVSPSRYSFFDFSYQSAGGATLALAAMGQTLVILSGGFDLSAGAVISLVNVVLGSSMQDTLEFANRVRYSRIGDRRRRRCIQWLFRCLPSNAVDRRHIGNDVHCSGNHATDHGDARRANSGGL